MIYVDNAATSFPKPKKVYTEMLDCLENYCANPGRGSHEMSIICSKAIFSCREVLANFFNIPNPLNICFTKNATEALNLSIKGVLKDGDHVITSSMEHNSVIRPLKILERYKNVKVSVINANVRGEISIDDIKKSLLKSTKMIVITASSNVNGVIMPLKEIGRLARESGIIFLLDASQIAGTLKIDVTDMNIDMLAFPGHKGLMGPQGIGGLYVHSDILMIPLLEGGTGSNSENLFQPNIRPDCFESGTLNTPAIVGLKHGVEFINQVTLDTIRRHKHTLIDRLYQEMQDIKNIVLYSENSMEKNSGIVSFNIKDTDPSEVGQKLDKQYKIACRTGLHCAPLAHSTLGTLKLGGTVRLSVGYFNNINEVDKVLEALRQIASEK